MKQNPLFLLFKLVIAFVALALLYVALCVLSPELAVGLFALAVITAPWWFSAALRGMCQ